VADADEGPVDESAALVVERCDIDGIAVVVARRDFTVRGGTFGAAEADAFERACTDAAATGRPLLTWLRSGGTRLQEGMRALVGIPRATLALERLAAARVPHVSVADHPTTGGVWVAVGATADLRAAVRGATVGFSGPRVVEAMTGFVLPPGANTAERAFDAGLVDALVEPAEVLPWAGAALRALAAGAPEAVTAPAPVSPPDRHGWAQVEHSRRVDRPSGRELVAALVPDGVALRARDDTVAATVGHLLGRPVVAVAVAAARAGRVSPAGYRLLTRAAALAARLDRPLLTLVDTAGADPLPASEDDGVVAEIGNGLAAVLRCPSPTVAVVHGEGGSGGALAAAVTDLVAVTPNGWFAALAPEGAAAALRRSPQDAADLMRVAPAELVADGFADGVAPSDPDSLGRWLGAALDRLADTDPAVRRSVRGRRWSRPLGADQASRSP
jgi:acetyl-CoA carboxylase alpha subunit